MSMQLYDRTALASSRRITLNYSTSFSLGIRMLSSDYRWAVYAIYGFVRVADEIVDTFHGHDKARLLAEFKEQTYRAIAEGISTNPVLHSFQIACRTYNIGRDLIEPFFNSMEEDLESTTHSNQSYSEYIYGSAEVVGLMCLRVFCYGNEERYQHLLPAARALGSAFQKVNFIRDMKSDYAERGRVYFPGISFQGFDDQTKLAIISDIRKDFELAYQGIKQLPIGCRFGVYTAYRYYLKLLEKIERATAQHIMEERIRVPDSQKMTLLLKCYLRVKVNVL